MESERMSGPGTALTQTLQCPKWFARIAAGAVFLLGGVTVIGWALDLELLKSDFPGLPPSKPPKLRELGRAFDYFAQLSSFDKNLE